MYGVKAVSNLAGVTEHTLRSWERRYGLITPGRSQSKNGGNGHRVYNEEELRRILLAKQLTDAGIPIRKLSGMSTEDMVEQLKKLSSVEGCTEQDLVLTLSRLTDRLTELENELDRVRAHRDLLQIQVTELNLRMSALHKKVGG